MSREHKDLHATSDTATIADSRLESANEQGDIELTDRDMRRILASLPPGTSARDRRWLEDNLRSLIEKRLPFLDRLGDTSLSTAQQRQALAIATRARALRQALDGADPDVRRALIWGLMPGPQNLRLIKAPMPPDFWLPNEYRWCTTGRNVVEMSGSLAVLARCAEKVAKPSPEAPPRRGQPRKELPVVILRSLAFMFEVATGIEPTRRVERDPEDGQYDSGPFYQFAAAVWPVITGKRHYGLSAAMKKWGTEKAARNKYHIKHRNINKIG